MNEKLFRFLSSATLLAVLLPAGLPAFDPAAGDFTKANSSDIRVMSFNVHNNLVTNTSITNNELQRIFTAINPDVIVLNEMTQGITATQIKTTLETYFPSTTWTVNRGITDGWKPTARPEPKQTGKAKKPETAKGPPAEGTGAPARPDKLPASHAALQAFMRRMLFSIPPAKLPNEAKTSEPDADKKADEPKAKRRARPLPARRAKLALIEAMRDLAVRERAFADLAAPLLREFMNSRGASERAACMVALARIGAAHTELKVLTEAA